MKVPPAERAVPTSVIDVFLFTSPLPGYTYIYLTPNSVKYLLYMCLLYSYMSVPVPGSEPK